MMQGWVYVISNPSMPGIVKIGYTTNSPEQRAYDLYHTGCPQPYSVDYAIHVDNPYELEQKVHTRLSDINVGKEWFNCTCEFAATTIKYIYGNGIIYKEDFKKLEKEKIIREQKVIFTQNIAEEGQKRILKDRKDIFKKQSFEIENKYINELNSAKNIFDWLYFLCIAPFIFLLIIAINGDNILSIGLSSALVAILWKFEIFKKENSVKVKSILSEQQKELDKAYEDIFKNISIVINCIDCGQKLRIPIGKKIEISCPNCKASLILDLSHTSHVPPAEPGA